MTPPEISSNPTTEQYEQYCRELLDYMASISVIVPAEEQGHFTITQHGSSIMMFLMKAYPQKEVLMSYLESLTT